ncbi:MAG: TetR family transcriptional regulator C-terminal domain-containing protein [Gammaproteobacteria bacterium]|nr:TetR family transcriptional regulator C-terminal domain-containing protein [Gammaproteobacteria bacterium]
MAATARSTGRTASRERRRGQLIAATMKCIARKGMSSTSIGDVAKEAGLSQGIVNLHFESKDNLLTETLRHLANDYKTRFNKALESSGPDAAAKLLAVMELDLRPSVIDRQKIAVWFAFWGEVKSRPTYRRICNEQDRYYDEVVATLCAEIIADGNYKDVNAASVATALTSMTNGMWLSYLLSPRSFNRDQAMRAITDLLRRYFPQHYS